MTSKAEKDKQKQIQDRCQSLLNQMLKDDDNKYCVDCDSKGKSQRLAVGACPLIAQLIGVDVFYSHRS